MNTKALFLGGIGLSLMASLSYGVYAPIPDQEKGKLLTYTLSAGSYYDSNIFGAPSDRQESWVFDFSGKIKANYQPTSQSHLSLSYLAQLQVFSDRPGDDSELFNHTLEAKWDHTFSEKLFLEVYDQLYFVDNPESAITTNTLQTNQSYVNNVAYIGVRWNFSEKLALLNKYRNSYYTFDAPALQIQLDRVEHLYGLELSHKTLPESTNIAEYRFQFIDYDDDSLPKDSTSHFFLLGNDYEMQENLIFKLRGGIEIRDRDSGDDTTEPYGQFEIVYNYSEASFLSTAFVYRLREATDTVSFKDEESFAWQINGQHYLASNLSLGASVSADFSNLIGRVGFADVDERTYRAGVSLSYFPTNSLTLSASLDHDTVDSDSQSREQVRNRFSLNARFTY